MPLRMRVTPNGAGAIGIKRRDPASSGKAEDAESNDARAENRQTQRESGESRFASTGNKAA